MFHFLPDALEAEYSGIVVIRSDEETYKRINRFLLPMESFSDWNQILMP
jgi:hypothetical protein